MESLLECFSSSGIGFVSTLLKVLNDGNYQGVPEQIKRWNMAGGKVLDGLIRRREAEALLFEGEAWETV